MQTAQNTTAPASTTADVHERIRRRAEEIYVQSGRVPGRDIENWSQAEREILAEAETRRGPTAVVIKLNGVNYVGEYQTESSEGYTPGEFAMGSSVTVRLERDKMFIKRPNGKELETRIVRKME